MKWILKKEAWEHVDLIVPNIGVLKCIYSIEVLTPKNFKTENIDSGLM